MTAQRTRDSVARESTARENRHPTVDHKRPTISYDKSVIILESSLLILPNKPVA
jgi:hypothetical protein